MLSGYALLWTIICWKVFLIGVDKENFSRPELKNTPYNKEQSTIQARLQGNGSEISLQQMFICLQSRRLPGVSDRVRCLVEYPRESHSQKSRVHE